MEYKIWIDWFSLPAVFLLSLIFSMVAIYTGIRLSKIGQQQDGGSYGSVVGATIGLLAFLLAFTFNMAATRFDARKQLLLDEVNVINTTYLRAGLIAQPYRAEARKLIRRYVDLRVEAISHPDMLTKIVEETEKIQKQLWSMLVSLNDENKLVATDRFYIQSLNNMFDLQTKRVVVALQTRIPSTIWLGLYVVAVVAMVAVGYQFGAKQQRASLFVGVFMAIAFSSVLTLIADLDRAGSGTVEINQQPMLDLQKKLENLP